MLNIDGKILRLSVGHVGRKLNQISAAFFFHNREDIFRADSVRVEKIIVPIFRNFRVILVRGKIYHDVVRAKIKFPKLLNFAYIRLDVRNSSQNPRIKRILQVNHGRPVAALRKSVRKVAADKSVPAKNPEHRLAP